MIPDVNKFVDDYYNQDPFYGKIVDPRSFVSKTDGMCGDDMSFYILVKNNIITDIKYYTERGCGHTIAAGRYVAQFAKGKSIAEAMEISPAEVLDEIPKLQNGGQHCSILATNTFLNAVSEYLLD